MSTIRDIAATAGVSTAAASAALSGRSGTIGLSGATRSRILRVARELGYRPNPLASSLRTGRTRNIGVWLPNAQDYLAHPQGARNFWSICRVAGRHGYHVSMVLPDGPTFDPRLMDGCLIMSPLGPKAEAMAARLAASIPVLSIATTIPGAVAVRENHSWSACRTRAAEYLYDLGHRRLAVACLDNQGRQHMIPSQFSSVAAERGITVEMHAFAETPLDRRYPTVGQILALDPLPTAVFAIDDDYARALIGRLLYHGIRVPADVSVFSGSTVAELDSMLPRLTGLVLRYELELEELFVKFVGMIEEGAEGTEIRLGPLQVDLVERESCAPPRT